MSCDWDVFCVDCKEHLGLSDFNWWDEEMNILAKSAEKIAGISDVLDSIEKMSGKGRLEFSLHFSYGSHSSVDLGFFVKHRKHKLVAMSEYGAIYEEEKVPPTEPAR